MFFYMQSDLGTSLRCHSQASIELFICGQNQLPDEVYVASEIVPRYGVLEGACLACRTTRSVRDVATLACEGIELRARTSGLNVIPAPGACDVKAKVLLEQRTHTIRTRRVEGLEIVG